MLIQVILELDEINILNTLNINIFVFDQYVFKNNMLEKWSFQI